MARRTRAALTPRQQDVVESDPGSEGAAWSLGKREGNIEHLGSDLPDVTAGFSDMSSQHEKDATSGAHPDENAMGQEQSREERQARSAALRNAAAGLISEKDGRRASGKLKSISTVRVSPQASTQRGMKGPPRANPYDVAPSPDKLHQVKKRMANGSQPFSPLKRQARSASQTLAEREAEDQRLASAQLEQSDEGADDNGNSYTTGRQYRDFFSDAQVRAAAAADERDRAEGQAASEDAIGDEHEHPTEPSDEVEASTLPVRRSPRKKQNAQRSQRQISLDDADNNSARKTRRSAVHREDEGANAAQQALPQSLTPKRGRGRPKKIDSLGEDQTRARTSSAASAEYAPQTRSAGKPRISSGRVKKSSKPTNGEASAAQSPPPTVAQRARAAEQERKEIANCRARLGLGDVQFPPDQNDDEESELTPAQGPPSVAADDNAASSAGGQDDDMSGHESGEDEKAKPHKKSQSSSRANTSAKRGPAAETAVEPLPALDETQQRRLFGLWPDMLTIIRHAEVWLAKRQRCDDRQVRKLVRQCRRLMAHLEEDELSASDIEDYDSEVAGAQIAAQAEELCASGASLKGDAHTDRGDDIFDNLIPVLVKLLEATICSHERQGDGQQGYQISLEHELKLVEMMQFIQDVGYIAYRAFHPHKTYPVKADINSGILIPLRQLCNKLQKHYQEHVRAGQALVRATQKQALQRQRGQREERLSRQAEFQTELENKWKSLHWRRSGVEGNPLRFGPKAGRAKINHLSYPDYQPEFDSNGERFERMQVFSVRIGPTQPAIDRARVVDWTMPELDALQAELKTHPGEHVFEEIISRHCGPKGLLNRFNVTEIVVKAADLKVFWEERQIERRGVVDDWVKAVPIWTTAQVLAGQENEWTVVSIEDDVDADEVDDEIEDEAEAAAEAAAAGEEALEI